MNDKPFAKVGLDSPGEVRDGAAALYMPSLEFGGFYDDAAAVQAAEDAEDWAVAMARMNESEPDIPLAEVTADLKRRGRI